MTRIPAGLDVAGVDRIRTGLRRGLDLGVDSMSARNIRLGAPFVLAVYDTDGAPPFIASAFDDTLGILAIMEDRRVAFQGTAGCEKPLGDERYVVPGRYDNLSVLEMTALKTAEMWLAGRPTNLEVLHRCRKWPGATSSFGGRRVSMSLHPRRFLNLGFAGSGYAPEIDMCLTDHGIAEVHFELVSGCYIDTSGMVSDTFILGPPSTWSYPAPG